MRNWYRFTAKAETPEVAELSIFDYIGYYGVRAIDFIRELGTVSATKLKVFVNSPGGDVFDAIAILNALRMSGKEIEVTVMGLAASAASYITLAGDKRIMPDNAMQMVHNASTGIYGNAQELAEMVELLNKMDANLQATFVSRTGLSAEKVAELLSTDTWLTAAQCLELGLCDEVVPAIKMDAAYEVDRLPENVRALFEAAKPAVEPKADPTPPEPTFAEAATAAMKGAGLEAHTAAWLTKLETVEQVTAAIGEARQITTFLAAIGKPEMTDRFVSAASTYAEMRKAVLAERQKVDDETHIDSTPPGVNPIQSKQPEQNFSASGYWKNR